MSPPALSELPLAAPVAERWPMPIPRRLPKVPVERPAAQGDASLWSTSRTRLIDYAQLAKPRIAALVLITVATSALLADSPRLTAAVLLHALVGTALVSASSGAANQWLERRRDARMVRTSDRPLPAGRLAAAEVALGSLLLLALGTGYLALQLGPVVALWSTLTWLLYVLAYTPLKALTPLNTTVGAVAGAMPVWIGWTAAGRALDLEAAALWMIVYLWQFPHFMAIAWLYRQDYAAAGMQMLPVVDPSGHRAGAQAVVGALALLPVSLLSSMLSTHGAAGPWLVAVLAVTTLLGSWYAVAALAFARSPEESTARRLLRVSLVYLPVLWGVLLCAAPV